MVIKRLSGKKITIDKLAQIINDGFNGQMKHMDEKFEKIGKDMGEMKSDISVLKKDVKEINHKLDDVTSNANKIEMRVDYLENIMAVKKN